MGLKLSEITKNKDNHKYLGVTLESSVLDTLKSFAKDNGVSVSRLVNTILKDKINQQ